MQVMELKQTKILLSNLIEFVSLKYEQSKALLQTAKYKDLQSAIVSVCPLQQLQRYCLNPCGSAGPVMDNDSVMNLSSGSNALWQLCKIHGYTILPCVLPSCLGQDYSYPSLSQS